MAESDAKIDNYAEFWDFYVLEHSNPLTRWFHFTGTTLGLILLVWFLQIRAWHYLPLCLVTGYAFAWFSHFFIEKNKPATFKYPLWSFISDYKMMWFMLSGRMDAVVRRVENINK